MILPITQFHHGLGVVWGPFGVVWGPLGFFGSPYKITFLKIGTPYKISFLKLVKYSESLFLLDWPRNGALLLVIIFLWNLES